MGYPWYIGQGDPPDLEDRKAEWYSQYEKEKEAWGRISPNRQEFLLRAWLKADGST